MSNGHNVMDQRSRDRKISGWSYDVVVNRRARFSWFWTAWCEDRWRLHWRRSSPISISEEGSVSKSSVLKNTTDFYNEGRLLTWSWTTFEQPELVVQLKTYQIYSIYAYRMMTFRISTQDGIKLYLLQVKYLRNMSWKVCTSENTRFCSASNCIGYVRPRKWSNFSNAKQRLRSVVRRHIDQNIRTRNFKARNERIETGSLVKSQQGREASVERKVGKCRQWKGTGQCARGDSCSFSHESTRGQKPQ